MDQKGRGGFGEVSHHFAVQVVGNFLVVGVVQGNPQVRQRGGQNPRVNFDHIAGYFGYGAPMPQLSGMFPIYHSELDRDPWLEFYPGNLFFRGRNS